MTRRSSTGVFVGAALVGAAAGWLAARWHDSAHRADLFSARPVRRHAALGWLAGSRDPALVPVLRDYVAWERIPALRRKGERLLAAWEGGA